MTDRWTYFDVRWMCPRCGRFIAMAAITSEDFRDDSAYYGIRSEERATCGRCGEIEPQCRPIKEISYEPEPLPEGEAS